MQNWRIWAGVLLGLIMMLVARWVPILSPLIIGVVIGYIVRKPLRGIAVGAIVGIVGNLITLTAAINQPLTMITGGGIFGQTLAIYLSIFYSNPLLLTVLTTFMMVIGGAIGGALAASRLAKAYEKGLVRGEEVERIKEATEKVKQEAKAASARSKRKK